MKTRRAIRHGTHGPWGDSKRHLPLAELESRFAEFSPPKPHNGCLNFRQRFGGNALRLTAAEPFRDLRLRGIYLRAVAAGEIAVGDPIEVVSRA
jgi:hypothetical protein